MEEKSFIQIYKDTLTKNYANFSGRARRREYWGYALINFVVLIIAMILDNVLGLKFSSNMLYGYIYMVYAIATLLPGFGLLIRRLHDVNKSGWMVLIALIPLIGSIWLLVLLVKEGDRGANEYGPDPKNSIDNEIQEIGQQ